MLKKFVLAACAFLALAANANGVVDLRIYHSSTAADSWPKTLEALTILKVVEGDQVKVGQLLDFPCHNESWKEICSDAAVKAAHVAALKERNPALRGETISLATFQALGQSQEGINLPVSPAFKAKVDAPVVKTAAAAQPQAPAPAPTVAPATVSAASAPNQSQVTIDRDQVTLWAKGSAETAAHVRELDGKLNRLGKLVANEEARVASLEQQLKDATSAGSAKASDIEAELQTARVELARQRGEAQRAGVRIDTVEGGLKTVENDLAVATTDIRKGGLWLVGLTLLGTLTFIGIVINWRRTAATAQAVRAVPAMVEKKIDNAIAPIAQAVGTVKEDVETLEDSLAAIAAITTKIATVDFDGVLLKEDLRAIGDGGTVSVVVSVTSAAGVQTPYEVSFLREGQKYRPIGVALLSKDEIWSGQNVCRYLRRAAFERRLTTVMRPLGPLSVVPAGNNIFGDTIPNAA